MLVGGVKCNGTEHSKSICDRTDQILSLNMPDPNVPTESVWEESNQLMEPKSSHSVLVVPNAYVPKCKRDGAWEYLCRSLINSFLIL